MKNTKVLFLSILVLILFSLINKAAALESPVFTLTSKMTAYSEPYIFFDDFSNYSEGSYGDPVWGQENYDPANQTIEDGELHFYGDPSGEAISFIQGFDALDYIVEVKVKAMTKQGSAYICPRYQTVENKYEVVLDMQYDNVLLSKVVDDIWTNIKIQELGWIVQTNTWYQLKMQIEEETNRIKIWVNDTLYVDETDPDLHYSGLAILAYDWDDAYHIAFDDVKVYDITPPSISITSPNHGSEIWFPDITVTWNSDDADTGVDHYEVRLDENAWIDVGPVNWYRFTGLYSDKHTLTVRAFDKAGNSSTASIHLFSRFWLILLSIGGIIVVTVATAADRLKKRKVSSLN